MGERPDEAHLDALTLADLDAGGLGAERAQQATAHLAACPSCRHLQSDLRELSAVLGAAPAPPMPADVADRLDAALATASRTRGKAEGGAGRVVELAPHRRRWVAPLAAAAVTVAAIGVVGEVVRSADTSTDATSSSDAEPGFDEGLAAPPPAAGGEESDQRTGQRRPLVLSLQSFKRDVTRQLSGRAPVAAYSWRDLSAEDALEQQRCTPDRIAAKGDPLPALLDGREAYLYLAGPASDRVAIAVACKRGVPTVAARARVDLD
jgi:hypothetical protein